MRDGFHLVGCTVEAIGLSGLEVVVDRSREHEFLPAFLAFVFVENVLLVAVAVVVTDGERDQLNVVYTPLCPVVGGG